MLILTGQSESTVTGSTRQEIGNRLSSNLSLTPELQPGERVEANPWIFRSFQLKRGAKEIRPSLKPYQNRGERLTWLTRTISRVHLS